MCVDGYSTRCSTEPKSPPPTITVQEPSKDNEIVDENQDLESPG